MFCPNCGTEERQRSHFCRACGADLRPARTGLERVDTLTGAAINAREEIGRAIAVKIREMQTAKDLENVVEGVLPEIEKFLESPDERRLRRMRAGVIVGAIGAALTVFMFLLFLMVDSELLPLISIGLLPFLIGVAMVLNGWLFTVPSQSRGPSLKVQRDTSDLGIAPAVLRQGQLTVQPSSTSVTEHTTHQLQDEQAMPRHVRE